MLGKGLQIQMSIPRSILLGGKNQQDCMVTYLKPISSCAMHCLQTFPFCEIEYQHVESRSPESRALVQLSAFASHQHHSELASAFLLPWPSHLVERSCVKFWYDQKSCRGVPEHELTIPGVTPGLTPALVCQPAW